MKASVNFRDERRPHVRLKLPVTLVGLPFSSSLSAGDDLQFCIATAFPSGPSFRLSFRPNLPSSPFSLVLKSGLGPLGSSFSPSPIAVSAEFPLASSSAPTFRLTFKPRLGDFGIRRVVVSDAGSGDWPCFNRKAVSFPTKVLTGVEITTGSMLPITSAVAAKVRWGVRLPAEVQRPLLEEGKGRPALPSLMMNKISIEQTAEETKEVIARGGEKPADVAEVGRCLQRQVDELRGENVTMRKAVEEIMAMVAAKTAPGTEKVTTTTKAEVNKKLRNALMEE